MSSSAKDCAGASPLHEAARLAQQTAEKLLGRRRERRAARIDLGGDPIELALSQRLGLVSFQPLEEAIEHRIGLGRERMEMLVQQLLGVCVARLAVAVLARDLLAVRLQRFAGKLLQALAELAVLELGGKLGERRHLGRPWGLAAELARSTGQKRRLELERSDRRRLGELLLCDLASVLAGKRAGFQERGLRDVAIRHLLGITSIQSVKHEVLR